MNRFRNILVAIDTRFDQHQVVMEAAKLAEKSGARITIIDVLPEFSWELKMSLPDHEQVSEKMTKEKASVLENVAANVAAKGISVQTAVLHGQTSVEIIRHVLREKHDLVMRVTKGSNSKETSFFGRTAFRLLRKCPCALWLMQTDKAAAYQNILACVDSATHSQIDEQLNDVVCELAAEVAAYHGVTYSILHAWQMWKSGMILSRMGPDGYKKLHSDIRQHEEKLFNKLLERHGMMLGDENIFLEEGETPTVIQHFVKEHQTDLLVMGTVGRSGVQGIVMGNTAERILSRVECDVLAVKPADFESPIQLSDSA
jgi:nucleotide-binding universal stress UspA family protein